MVGETAGIGGSDAALAEGRLAASLVAQRVGLVSEASIESRLQSLRGEIRKARSFAAYLNRSFAPRAAAYERIPDDTVVCRCEEVTAGEVRQAALEGAESMKSLKILTMAGMGLCQGRVCNAIVTLIASLATSRLVESYGSASSRAPIKPVRLGVLADAEF